MRRVTLSSPLKMNLARPTSRAFSLAWEKIDDLRADGVDDLLIQDWNEIEQDIVSRPFDPDWDRLRVLEKQGYFLTLAARDLKRNIVGYNAFHVMPDILSKRTTIAVNRVIWALPEWRRRVGLALILEAERRLLGPVARRIEYNAKVTRLLDGASGGRLGRLLALRGYNHVEAVFARCL